MLFGKFNSFCLIIWMHVSCYLEINFLFLPQSAAPSGFLNIVMIAYEGIEQLDQSNVSFS